MTQKPKGPCTHCFIPDRSKWTSQCAYHSILRTQGWTKEQVDNLRASGSDNPCAFDDYDDHMAELAADSRRFWFRFLLTVAAIIGVIAYAIS